MKTARIFTRNQTRINVTPDPNLRAITTCRIEKVTADIFDGWDFSQGFYVVIGSNGVEFGTGDLPEEFGGTGKNIDVSGAPERVGGEDA